MRLGFQSDKEIEYLVKGEKENKKKSVIFSKRKKKAERLNYQYQVQSVNYEKNKNQEEMQRLT